ncbi:helix-turn-helix domain-containing protein [Novosphingobium sp. FSY-8]|uniref:Helix-turn-helix domain-containing protein n=1 Tax=Novosphingobium ovatum TaxID=1908523 RepID=A0ABW9XE01_9SPHN|nr:AraC family transcriptional regulator [Novosphingobium ovatum]NBC36677.1 helix-turn-helix domain-containing protein [Novosphingobium ovatum]
MSDAPVSAPDLGKLQQAIVVHTPLVGENATAITGLSLYRRIAQTPCYRAIYDPSLTLFAQGCKAVNVGGVDYQGMAGRFLITSVDLPVQSQVIDASAQRPLLSMLLSIDSAMLREVIAQQEPQPARPAQGALALGEASPDIIDACARLVGLLDRPHDIGFMAPLIQREILYRLLQTPQAARLRAIASASDHSHRTARAIGWLRRNYDQPLRIEALADLACMGVSTLHHHFRALTAMSPLQYQKQLRLQAAREKMIGGLDATGAAYAVGYESVSQFSREYARLFGQPPLRDMKALKD